MGAKAERVRKRRIKLVGGGFRYNREPNGVAGGTMKSLRRLERKAAKLKRKGKGR